MCHNLYKTYTKTQKAGTKKGSKQLTKNKTQGINPSVSNSQNLQPKNNSIETTSSNQSYTTLATGQGPKRSIKWHSLFSSKAAIDDTQ